jgi:hypothetical protein
MIFVQKCYNIYQINIMKTSKVIVYILYLIFAFIIIISMIFAFLPARHFI